MKNKLGIPQWWELIMHRPNKKTNKKKNKSNSSNSFLGLAFDTSTTSHDSVENKLVKCLF